MSKLIPRNTVIPTRKSRIFSTTLDDETFILVQVFEGERSLVKDNNLHCKLLLTDIPPAPRGVPQIEVTLEIDANGIMKASAANRDTGKSKLVTITNKKGRLTRGEIDRMIAEFAAEDEARKQRIEALDSLSSHIHYLKSQLGDSNGLGGRLDDDDKKALLGALESVTITIEKGRLAQGVYLMAGGAGEFDDEGVPRKKRAKGHKFQPPYTHGFKSKLSEWVGSAAKRYSGPFTPPKFFDGDDEPIHNEL